MKAIKFLFVASVFFLVVTCGTKDAVAANTVVCATNAQELIADLHDATDSYLEDPYIIHVQEGTYVFTAALDFLYSPNVLARPTYVQGGYLGPQCTGGRNIDYRQTVLDLGGHDMRIFQINDSLPSSRLEFDDMTIENAAQVLFGAGHWGGSCPLCSDSPGKVVLQDVRITGVTGQVKIDVVKSSQVMTNAQFDHLGSPGDGCQVKIVTDNDIGINLNHVTADLSGGRNFCIETYSNGDNQTIFANSIFWSSDGSGGKLKGMHSDISDSPINVQLNHSIYQIDASGFGNVSTIDNGGFNPAVDPQWNNPAAGDYGLKVGSPAVDTGTTAVLGGEPATDAIGNPRRTAASNPDRGAIESPWTTVDLFDVTNTNDSGAGSLRAAIINANNSTAAHATIRFVIFDPANPQQGLCPAVINLASQLPDIGHAKAQTLLIDGYTQVPSRWNADAEAFDGALCVALAGAGANYGLRVPAQTPDPANGGALVANQVSLYLSGLGIGNFRNGVALFGGRDHTIVGNQFGGLMPTTTGLYQLYGFDAYALNVNIPGDAGTLRIGGSYVRDRNVFLNATSFGAFPYATAIQIGYQVASDPAHCQIIGNTIGVPADGMQVPPTTDYGLQLQGNGCYVSGNRFAGMKKDAIYVNGGDYNVIQSNTLGLFPYGFDLSSVNNGSGIRLNGSHNTVGEPADTGGDAKLSANLIENMGNAGIVGMSGAGNTIRGNSLLYNGLDDADLNIDLGEDGPTQNDGGDGDSGPNNRQNYPALHGVSFSGTPLPATKNLAVTVSASLNSLPGPGFYQVDLYYDGNGCTPGGRGSARTWIGTGRYVYIAQGASRVGFQVPVNLPAYFAGGAISITATNDSNGDGSTSEISECITADTLFRDAFQD